MFFFQSQNRKNHCVQNTPKTPHLGDSKAISGAHRARAHFAPPAYAVARPRTPAECEEAAPDVATTTLTHWFCPLDHPQSRGSGAACILHTKCPPCLSGRERAIGRRSTWCVQTVMRATLCALCRASTRRQAAVWCMHGSAYECARIFIDPAVSFRFCRCAPPLRLRLLAVCRIQEPPRSQDVHRPVLQDTP